MKHNTQTTTIGLFEIGKQPIFKNAKKTAVVYLPQLQSTLKNVNSQVKNGLIWSELSVK